MTITQIIPIIHTPYAIAAYRKACEPGQQARRVFSVVFERAIAALDRLQDHREDEPIAFMSAIQDNLMLWEHLLADVRNPKNPLPAETRSKILSLGGFVRAQSKRIRDEEAPVKPLIDINKSILEGLLSADEAQVAGRTGSQSSSTVEQAI